MIYTFILGKNTALSVAEIISVLKRDLFVFVVLSISQDAIIIKLDKELENPQFFLDRLGGTIKIAQIFEEFKEKDIAGPILEYITNNFKDSKFVFGLSSYGIKVGRLGYEIKKELKKIGVNSRFIQGKYNSLSAPEIQNNKILTHGADFVLIRSESKVFIGKTIAIQDYQSYSYRDYERPRRNAKSGMLPPKVAQVMLNLTPLKANEGKSHKLIYDPFCGQGTILQEALLMDLAVIGSDISDSRVFDTKQNLKWLAQEYNLEIESNKIVFQADALNISQDQLPADPDVIVSEVYLGPPLTGRESEKEISELTKNLEQEYIKFLKNTHNLLPTTYCCILALPFYKTRNKPYFLNIIDEAKNIGYNVLSPFENTEIDLGLLKEYNRERKTVLYAREDQIVGMEIIILSRKD